MTEFTATLYGERDTFTIREVGVYEDNTPALAVYDSNGEPWSKLTVCIPGTELGEGEYLIKTWSENEPMREHILATGDFDDTGRRVATGHVEAEVWKKVTKDE